jgi:hypothetical protein
LQDVALFGGAVYHRASMEGLLADLALSLFVLFFAFIWLFIPRPKNLLDISNVFFQLV